MKLGEVTDEMRVAEDVLTGLNLLGNALSAQDIEVNRHILIRSGDSIKLWRMVSAFTSGSSMLKRLFNDGSIKN